MLTSQTQYLMIMVRGILARAENEERGVSAVEWVIITAVLAALAIAVGAVITSKVQGKADNLDLGQ